MTLVFQSLSRKYVHTQYIGLNVFGQRTDGWLAPLTDSESVQAPLLHCSAGSRLSHWYDPCMMHKVRTYTLCCTHCYVYTYVCVLPSLHMYVSLCMFPLTLFSLRCTMVSSVFLMSGSCPRSLHIHTYKQQWAPCSWAEHRGQMHKRTAQGWVYKTLNTAFTIFVTLLISDTCILVTNILTHVHTHRHTHTHRHIHPRAHPHTLGHTHTPTHPHTRAHTIMHLLFLCTRLASMNLYFWYCSSILLITSCTDVFSGAFIIASTSS